MGSMIIRSCFVFVRQDSMIFLIRNKLVIAKVEPKNKEVAISVNPKRRRLATANIVNKMVSFKMRAIVLIKASCPF